MSRKQLIILGVLLGFVLMITLSLVSWRNSRESIVTVTTDELPVQLDIGGHSYDIAKNKTTIRIPKDAYDYRATKGSGEQAIRLYGNIDAVQNSSAKIVLNYSVFSTSSIKASICTANHTPGASCVFQQATMHVTYVDDHAWAVVQAAVPNLEPAKAVLRLNNGQWQVAAGPGSDLGNLVGAVPQAVVEAVNNE